MTKNEIVLFQDENLELKVNVSPEQDTVWLTANQMSELYGRDEKTIRKHINKIFADNELERENNTQKMRVDGVKQPVAYYDLDVIISVGYRVNSKRGIAFRKWARLYRSITDNTCLASRLFSVRFIIRITCPN